MAVRGSLGTASPASSSSCPRATAPRAPRRSRRAVRRGAGGGDGDGDGRGGDAGKELDLGGLLGKLFSSETWMPKNSLRQQAYRSEEMAAMRRELEKLESEVEDYEGGAAGGGVQLDESVLERSLLSDASSNSDFLARLVELDNKLVRSATGAARACAARRGCEPPRGASAPSRSPTDNAPLHVASCARTRWRARWTGSSRRWRPPSTARSCASS